MLGCLPNFLALHELQVTKGRFLTEEDNHRMAEHCVLSAGVSRELFPFGDCLGKSVSIYGNLYEVVGEVGKRANLEDKQRVGFREEFQDNIYLPIETVWAKVFDYYYRGYDGSNMYSKVTLTLENDGKAKIFAVTETIKAMLKEDHGMEDFQIAVPIELRSKRKTPA